ncbi:serine/threonine-protein kinase [Caulobacter hibisci]|uniref:Uncharacterized protein n=1 Tax=Caulobacter hibisci TaxID=2035993 RepID=A0ABS0T2T4_9CAUL|nr:hypothetical protein [Caulobacter hibisci]MBI1686195.1 hypothetical protein [Caulobacter hibisci]
MSETFGRRRPDARPTGPRLSAPVARSWPAWPRFVLAMIPAYLLQQIPLVDLVLLFALSPLWIGLLFNGALVAMVVDAWRGAAPRWIVAVPVLVYGGNLVWSAAGYLDYRALDARLRRENAAQRLAFDPARTALLAPGQLAQTLVERYALPVVYRSPDVYGSGQPAALRVLPRATCETIPKSPDLRMTTQRLSVGRALVSNACLLTLPGAPPGPALRVDTGEGPGDLEPGLRRLTLTAPDGRTVALAYGIAAVPSPIPFPLVGCFTWTRHECTAGFYRLKPVVGGGAGGHPAMIAAALGLAPRPVNRIRTDGKLILALDEAQTRALATGSEPAVAEARAYGRRAVAGSLDRFSRLMAGEDLAPDEAFDRWIVVSNADQVDAEALLAAIRRAHGDPSRSDAQRTFGAVAAALPAQAFARIGPRLAPLGGADEALAGADWLAVRLGDVGAPAALPLATRVEAGRGVPGRTDALLGLCRAGPAAAGVADRVAAIPRSDSRGDVIEASMLALLRMGRRDLAQPLAALPATNGFNGAARRGYRKQIEQILAEVGPASPRSACRLDRDDRLPRVPWLAG